VSRPLGILLRAGGHDAAHYALVLATGAAAIGRPVTLFATNEGCHLLLAAAPLEADPREALLAERGVAGIAMLLPAAEELGVALMVCEAGMRAEALEGAALRRTVTLAGVVSFLHAVGEGQFVSL